MANSPLIFDRKLIAARAARARALGPATFLLERAAGDLVERLSTVKRKFPLAVDLGTPADILRKALSGNSTIGSIVATGAHDGASVIADDEILPFRNESLDLVVSALALQSVNDLPGTLAQIRYALKPDGLFLAIMPGGTTLFELRESLMRAELELAGGAGPRVSPFVDVRDANGKSTLPPLQEGKAPKPKATLTPEQEQDLHR